MINGINIIVWRNIIVDYAFISTLIGSGELIKQANMDEIKRYWARP